MALIDIAIIGLYFLLLIGLGFWYRRRAAKDLEAYFLAGKRMHWLVLAMSGAVGNFDITGTMWMISVLFLLGMRSWWHHWMWGVMLPAFGLAYMARWVRRSRVMTAAEWMVTRFGDCPGGRVARTTYALLAVITLASFIGYAFQGIGKFAAVYIPLEDLSRYMPFLQELVTTYRAHTLAAIIMGATTLYVLLGGLYSVVVTDVIQTVILGFAALLIAGVAYGRLTPEVVHASVPPDFTSLWPPWRLGQFAGTQNAGYEMFGLLFLSWVLKGFLLNAGGPGQMYDFQRYLAARNSREASKLAAAWPFFLVPRWGMVAGITLLAMAGIANISDPEQVMPVVLKEYLPSGLRGLVIAGLLAAFTSTFAGTVNSGASYIVRDLWQPLLRAKRDKPRLIRLSYIATIAIVVLGIAIGSQAQSIAEIWNWIMMALGAGVIIPNVMRWHWWRLNGWGYAAGTLGGILLSLTVLFVPRAPVYFTFPAICAGSFAACVITSWLTRPADPKVLADFYWTVRPFGFWKPVRDRGGETRARTCKEGSGEAVSRTVLNTGIAIVGVSSLYLFPMYLVGHWHLHAVLCLCALFLSAGVLYFTWYREL